MSFEYNAETVVTQTGEIDVAYYRQEAARMRSEEVFSIYKALLSAVKKMIGSQAQLNQNAANMFLADKMAK
jgi:hypothetical protein